MLGWTDPGIGLLWYYNNDRNDFGDYRLQVLKQLWDSDDQLALLAAWIWRYRDQNIRNHQLAPVFPSQEPPPPAELQLAAWWENFHRKYPAETVDIGPNPYYGGCNALHLGHFDFLFERDHSATLLALGPADRTACLMLENCNGWYAALVR